MKNLPNEMQPHLLIKLTHFFLFNKLQIFQAIFVCHKIHTRSQVNFVPIA